MTYTALAVVAVLATVVLDLVLGSRVLASKAFWLAYAIILVFQLITNGILTGRGVVAYSGHAVLGVGSAPGQRPPFLGHGRVVFAPVEDLLFGFALVVQTLSWWTFWGRRSGPERGRPARGDGSEAP